MFGVSERSSGRNEICGDCGHNGVSDAKSAGCCWKVEDGNAMGREGLLVCNLCHDVVSDNTHGKGFGRVPSEKIGVWGCVMARVEDVISQEVKN